MSGPEWIALVSIIFLAFRVGRMIADALDKSKPLSESRHERDRH